MRRAHGWPVPPRAAIAAARGRRYARGPVPPAARAMSSYLSPILLLIASNIFMTFAWYGHLKFKTTALWIVILASWGIAFFEYLLMVPANRIGHAVYSAAQLKTIQEVITLTVFAGFSVLYLGEALKWNHLAAFGLLIGAAWLMFLE